MCDTCGNAAHEAEGSENEEPEVTIETPEVETPSTEEVSSDEDQVA